MRRNVVGAIALSIAVWFAAYLYLAARGVFQNNVAGPIPLLPIGLLLPLVAGFVAFQTMPAIRSAIERIPQEHLIGIQGVRLMGFAFLLLLAQSKLPALFALPAGLGDMLVGFEAFFVASLYVRRAESSTTMGLLWNAMGIADFIVALSVGFLASTTPLQLLHLTPTTDIITALPMVMVPVFGVPLFLMLHLLSLAKGFAELRTRSNAMASVA
jgi:hypothetical protein